MSNQQEYYVSHDQLQLKSILSKYVHEELLVLCSKSVLAGNPSLINSLPLSVKSMELIDNRDLLGEESIFNTLRKTREFFDGKSNKRIISIGGGSTIDLGKAMIFYMMNLRDNPNSEVRIGHTAMPTTIGSGSESTQFATVWSSDSSDQRVKSSLDTSFLLPDNYIISIDLIDSLPRAKQLASVWDAICHGIESLIAKKATPQSIFLAENALKNAFPIIHRILEDESPLDSQELLRAALAANSAGRAINITRTNICHSISYPLTRRYGISHGIACSASVYALMEFLNESDDCIVSDPAIREFLIPSNIRYLSNLTEELVPHFNVLKEAINSKDSKDRMKASIMSSGRTNGARHELSDLLLQRIFAEWENRC